ncbi:MAG: DUF1700 domain-containing protein [Lachnospiraceae bacterium]|nr:DUF1700 domain-containing protein [Lachnospiraceae bacterium]
MTKYDFLDRLDSLLTDLPDEERMRTIWYYEDYFAEAGEARVETILQELGSPERVAAEVRASYRAGGSQEYKESAEYATGFADAERRAYEEEMYEQYDEADAYTYGGTMHEDTYRTNPNEQYGGAGGYGGQPGGNGGAGGISNDALKIVLIVILLCTVGFPIVLPVLFAIVAVAGGLFLGLGAAGVTLIAAGVVAGGVAILHIGLQAGLGILLLGIGLVLLALGLLFLSISLNCGFRAIPAVVRGFVNVIRALLGRKGAGHEKVY